MQIFDFIYLTYNHLKYFLSEYVEMSATIIISIIISMTSIYYLFILVIYLTSVVNDSEWTGTIFLQKYKAVFFVLF